MPTANGLTGEDTLFFDDATAASLSGTADRVDAVGIVAANGQRTTEVKQGIMAALPDPTLRVLSGTDKGGNAAATTYAARMQDVSDLTSFTVSISAFVCIFVVAVTAAFSIRQRSQEIALLRLIGSTPRQVKTWLLEQYLLLALAAAIVGVALGAAVSLCTLATMASGDVARPRYIVRGMRALQRLF